MIDDTEPMFLTFKTYDAVEYRTASSAGSTGSKEIIHALRPMEGATDIWNDPCTLACDDDEFVYGNRRNRAVSRANVITCGGCLVAVTM